MKILAVETSCDDTCIAIIEAKGKINPRFEILSNIVSSQVKIHAKYGGVYPTLAKREHQKNLPLVLKKVLKEAKNPKIDLIALTIGPGLEPCLWTGVNFAKSLSYSWELPLVPINHIEAHILANWLKPVGLKTKIFPAVCLVVSGGHTQLILMKDFGQYKILGETRDDAAGECFDKTARILGLGYPGGPAIAAEAAKFQVSSAKFQVKLPRPMIHQKNYDFSFSGLKTAVLYKVKNEKRKTKNKEYVRAMCTEIQQAIIDVLIYKTLKAAKDYKAKAIILGGGVAANDELRKQFFNKFQVSSFKFQVLVPSKNFCTDNAAMVGITGYYQWLKGETKPWKEIRVDANLRIS